MAGIGRYSAGLLALSCVFAQAPAPPDVVLRFDVNLVQVDAVVTDSRGNHMPGLKAENFDVLQDGKAQKITHFSYISGEASRAAKAAESTPHLPAPAPTREEVRRTIVFMLDDATMEFASFHYAQEAVLRYIDEQLQPNDMAAVTRTSYGSGALQIFTSDAVWLHSAVQRMVWRPSLPYIVSPLLNDLMRAVRALAQYPGRKSIVLISPGMQSNGLWSTVRSIADAANRASVTIEAIDCRGLPTLQSGADVASMPSSLGQRSTDYFHSQDVLSFLAEMTAGRFQHENNDTVRQVQHAVDDAEGYYLIGWYPGPDAFKTKPGRDLDYHRVKIHLRNAKGLAVRTRDGFFAYRWHREGRL